MQKYNLYAFVFLLILNSLAYCQTIPRPQVEFNPRYYIVHRAEEKITVDGALNEKSWRAAEWTEDFIDIEGDIRPAPRFRTRAKMLWDDEYFYVAAELQEPDIWATLTNRDDIIFYDNDFEIFIDPDGDTHRYLEFEMNAFNTVWDLLLIKPYRDTEKAALHGYDIKGLKSGVRIYGTINKPGDIDSCWTVEVAFPWSAFEEITDINLPPQDGDKWRINFSRVEWRTTVKDNRYAKIINPETGKPYPEDNWVWTPQGVVNMHYPEMWGFVQFTTNTAYNKNIDFKYDDVEEVKWFLRQLYYAQREYYERNKRYTDDLTLLDLPETNKYETTVEATANLYEAEVKINERSSVRITQDGLIKIINRDL
ncbi:carbohydrate-binding family 9-like protein [Melioribacter roseus P3M-2]|uniref:Carbohydrate-binding family 9-like protein n=2 Tax=Melioribacteraceae TaxID=1334117 RepID=I6ZRX6_MELRP|nr:carbohydrate-binding family 9-like protein [Melioribacter roseus P3M-2]